MRKNRTKGYMFIKKLFDTSENGTIINQKFGNETGTKATTYRKINPNLTVHRISNTGCYIDERETVVFTKFRLSSHTLKVETGRWSRTPREERLCECGKIQDENHIVFFCNKTNDLRGKYGVNGELYQRMGKLLDQHPLKELVDFIDSCSSRF